MDSSSFQLIDKSTFSVYAHASSLDILITHAGTTGEPNDSASFGHDNLDHQNAPVQQPIFCESNQTIFNTGTSNVNHVLCPTCQRPVHNEDLLVQSNSNKLYPCSDCESSFLLADNLVIHQLLVHKFACDQILTHNCPLCGKWFKRLAAFKSHLLIHEVDEDMLCPQCHRLIDIDNWPKPRLSGTNSGQRHEMQYRCNICGMMLSSVGKVKQHYRRRHPNSKSQSPMKNEMPSQDSVPMGVRNSKARALADLSELIKSIGRKPRDADSIYDSLIKEIGSTGESELIDLQTKLSDGVSKRARKIKYKCSFCNKKFAKPCLLKRHLTTHTNEKPFMCILCESRFTQKSSAKAHLSQHLDPSQTLLSVYANSSKNQIVDFGKPITQPPPIAPLLLDVSYVQICTPTDPQTFKKWDPSSNLLNPISYSNPLPVVQNVDLNNLVLSSDDCLLNHVPIAIQAFACPVCSKNFLSSRTLSIHMRRHFPKSTISLADTVKSSIRNSHGHIATLKNHTKNIHGTNQSQLVRCYKCTLAFESVEKLKSHECSKSAYHHCYKCTRRFLSHTSLEKHYLICHRSLSKRSIKCFICLQTFVSISQWEHHMNMHSNERLFSCYVCHKRFKFPQSCRKHIRSHSNLEFDSLTDQQISDVTKVRPTQKVKTTTMKKQNSVCDGSQSAQMTLLSPIVVDLNRYPWNQTLEPSNVIESHTDSERFVDVPDSYSIVQDDPATGIKTENNHTIEQNPVIMLPDNKVCYLQGVPLYVVDSDLPNEFVSYPNNNLLVSKDFQPILVDGESTSSCCVLINPSQSRSNEAWNPTDGFTDSSQEPFIQAVISELEVREPNSIVGSLQPDASIDGLAYDNIALSDSGCRLIPSNDLAPTNCQISLDTSNFSTIEPMTISNLQNISNNSASVGPYEETFTTCPNRSFMENPDMQVKQCVTHTTKDKLDPQTLKRSKDFLTNKRSYFGCGRCKRNYQNPKHLQAHHQSCHSHLPKPFKCSECSRAFANETLLLVHQRSHYPDLKDDLSCPCCPGIDFTNRSGLTRHIVYCHPPSTVPQPFRCSECGLEFRLLRTLKAHVNNKLDGNGTCRSYTESSDTTLAYNSVRKKHSLSVPLLDASLVGQIAKLQPSEKLTLSEKYLIKAATEKVEGVVTLPNASPASRHQNIHSQSNSCWSCSKCGRKFSRPSGLRSHMLVHLSDRHKCDFCLDVFSRRSELRKHLLLIHPTEYSNFKDSRMPKLICHLCGLTCASRSSLRMHVRLHTGTRRYQCPHCLAIFYSPSHRKRHLSKCLTWLWSHSRYLDQASTQLSRLDKSCVDQKQDHEDDIQQLQEQPHSIEPLPDNLGLIDIHPDPLNASGVCGYLDSTIQPDSATQSTSTHIEAQNTVKVRIEQSIAVDLDATPKLDQHNLQVCDQKSIDCVPNIISLSELQIPGSSSLTKTDVDIMVEECFPSANDNQILSDLFQKLFQCTTCSQSFTSQSLYRSHSCSKSYSTKVQTKKIKSVKLSPRRSIKRIYQSFHKLFKCSKCKRTFGKQSTLMRHERIHNQNRPFVCKICGQRFIQSFSLTSHELIHQNHKPYQCPHCDSTFRQRCNLLRHIRSLHS